MTNEASKTYLRAFGMSGAQILSDLRQIERETNQRILVEDKVSKERKLAGYDQFETDIRSSASKMSEYYEIFFCLEVSIRRLVENILTDAEGVDWWESDRVDQGLRNEVANIQRKEEASAITARSENPLDYLTFGQLGQLITSNFDLFEVVLSSKGAVSRIMNQLNLLRGPIAHCCVLAEDEMERLELSVRDWFRIRA